MNVLLNKFVRFSSLVLSILFLSIINISAQDDLTGDVNSTFESSSRIVFVKNEIGEHSEQQDEFNKPQGWDDYEIYSSKQAAYYRCIENMFRWYADANRINGIKGRCEDKGGYYQAVITYLQTGKVVVEPFQHYYERPAYFTESIAKDACEAERDSIIIRSQYINSTPDYDYLRVRSTCRSGFDSSEDNGYYNFTFDYRNVGSNITRTRTSRVFWDNLAPNLNFRSPANNISTFKQRSINFDATASDRESGNLSNAIRWRFSDGYTKTGRSFTRAFDKNGTYTVTAEVFDTDRYRKNRKITRTITVRSHSIELSNIEADLETPHEANEPVSLSVAIAKIDGQNAGSRVHWKSSLDGDIGTGFAINPLLSVGSHTITASLSLDGDTKTRTKNIEIADSIRIGEITADLDSPHNAAKPLPLSISFATINNIDKTADVQWVSDIDGELGYGKNIEPLLSPGEHIITAKLAGFANEKEAEIRVLIGDRIELDGIDISLQSPHESYIPVPMSIAVASVNGEDRYELVQWISNIDGLLGSGQSISPRLSPGTHEITVKLNTESISKNLAIVADRPFITLASPMGGRIFDIKELINFSSVVMYRGEELTSANVTWTSNIAGLLGNGLNFSRTNLPEGVHYITASVNVNDQIDSKTFVITIYDSQKNLGVADGQCFVGNPINLLTGNKYQLEVDFSSTVESSLSLSRHYNSMSKDSGLFGAGWSSTLDERLEYDTQSMQVAIYNASGSVQRFDWVNGEWVDNSSAKGELIRLNDNSWQYTTFNQTVRHFNEYGQLLEIRPLNGLVTTYHYNNGQLSRIEDAYGRSLVFTYNESDYISTMTDPDGHVYRYNYSGNNLTSIAYPDNTPSITTDNPSRQYLYEDSRYASALTGLIDEEGHRFATWRYDEFGRAVLSKHAGEAEEYTITYNDDASVTTTNSLGKKTTYNYESIKGILKVVDVTGHQSENCAASYRSVEYDEYGFPSIKTDWRNNQILLKNNKYGQVTSKTIVDTGAEWTSTIDERVTYTVNYNNLMLPAVTTKPGLETRTEYTVNGRVARVVQTDKTTHSDPYSTNGESRIVTYSYTFYPDSPVVKSVVVDGPRDDIEDVIVNEYDSFGNLIKVTNALGHVVQYSGYNSRGNPTRKIESNGLVTNYEYTPRGWLKRKVTHSSKGEIETVYIYYKNGNIKTQTEPNGVVWTYFYNDASHLIKVQNNAGEQKVYAPNELTGEWRGMQYQSSGGEVHYQLERLFDEKGRVRGMQSPTGLNIQYKLDPSGNITEINQEISAKNNQQTKSSRNYYDAYNRLRRSEGDDLPTVNYTYSPAGNLTHVIAQGEQNQVTEYIYNGFGELIQLKSPGTGTTTYYRDKSGNVVREINNEDQEIIRQYDAINRITHVQYLNSEAENVHYRYDESINATGLLSSVTDQSGETIWEYDDLGQFESINYTISGTSYILDYNFNQNGQLLDVIYPSGQAIHYSYNNLGKVIEINASGGPHGDISLVDNIVYEPFGPVNSFDYGNGSGYKVKHDLNYRIERLSHGWLTQKEHIDYSFDSANRLYSQKRLVENSQGVTSLSDEKSFQYDLAGRLKNVSWDILKGESRTGEFIAYEYDVFGNRTRELANSPLNNITNHEVEYFIDASNNRLNNKTYIRNGDRLNPHPSYPRNYVYKKTGQVSDYSSIKGLSSLIDYEYNHQQRMDSIYVRSNLLANYLYNARGERVSKTVDGKTIHFHYIAGKLIAETTETGQPIRQYVYLGNRPVAMIGSELLYPDNASNETLLKSSASIEIDAEDDQTDEVLKSISGKASISAVLTSNSESNESSKLGLTLREQQDGKTGVSVDVYLVSSISRKQYLIPVPVNEARTEFTFIKYSPVGKADIKLVIDITNLDGTKITEEFENLESHEIKLERDGQFVRLYVLKDGAPEELLKEVFLPTNDEAFIGVIGENIKANLNVSLSQANDNLYYLHTDHLTTITKISSNRSQSIVWERKDFESGASPFGKDRLFNGEALHQGIFEMPLRFPGQYYDKESRLSYNYFRYYDPATGRYMRSDPIGLQGGVNTYGYVGGNPTGFVDPLGLEVTAVYIKQSGRLVVYDNNTGQGVSISNVFSGSVGENNAIPTGSYEILERAGKPYWYRLDAIDGNLRDDTHEETGRTAFRLHPGRISAGCITVPNKDEYQELFQIISNTETTSVIDNFSPVWKPWAGGKNSITKYGELHVVDAMTGR